MITCCELAVYNGNLALYIALAAFGLVALLILCLFGYHLKVRKDQVELSKRTAKLEKKNGHEQAQIDELKKKIEQLETKS